MGLQDKKIKEQIDIPDYTSWKLQIREDSGHKYITAQSNHNPEDIIGVDILPNFKMISLKDFLTRAKTRIDEYQKQHEEKS